MGNNEFMSKIENIFQDDLSLRIFNGRINFLETGSMMGVRDVIATRSEGRSLIKMINEHNKQELILFGCGFWGKCIKRVFDNVKWSFFSDNNNFGHYVDGVYVLSERQLVTEHRDSFVFVTSKYHGNEIKTQLVADGFRCSNIFLMDELIIESEKGIYFDFAQLPHKPNESFIDAGAFDGATTNDFIKWSGDKYSKIIQFEPSHSMCKELKARYIDDRIVSICKGLLDANGTRNFVSSGTELSNVIF